MVKEFYTMRQFILQRSTAEWQEVRRQSKLTRKSESDTIKTFIEYARHQGSRNADRYYTLFSKLVNGAVGVNSGERETAQSKTLRNIDVLEDIIVNTISEQMKDDVFYKDIYATCRDKIQGVTGYLCLR